MLGLAGLPLLDIVHDLGMLAAPSKSGPVWWWTVGFSLHVVVGAIWAIFYAYFFWSLLGWRTVVQGLVFSLLPTMLALLIAYPQLRLMQIDDSIVSVDPVEFFGGTSWREAFGLLLGHLIYGATLGALYTHPVGYRTRQNRAEPGTTRRLPCHSRSLAPSDGGSGFIFATGIECSYPTIEGGRWRASNPKSLAVRILPAVRFEKLTMGTGSASVVAGGLDDKLHVASP